MEKTKRQIQAEETKLNLFNCAIALLEEKDFDDIKIQDIVKKANVSVGSFYKYYESKIDVFYHAYIIADNYFEKTVKNLIPTTSVEEQLRIYFKEYALYSSDISGIKLTKLIYNSSNTLLNRNHTKGMLGLLTKIIEYGIKNGEITKEYKASYIVEYLMISARGLVYNWCVLDGNYKLEEKMIKFMTLSIQSILKK